MRARLRLCSFFQFYFWVSTLFFMDKLYLLFFWLDWVEKHACFDNLWGTSLKWWIHRNSEWITHHFKKIPACDHLYVMCLLHFFKYVNFRSLRIVVCSRKISKFSFKNSSFTYLRSEQTLATVSEYLLKNKTFEKNFTAYNFSQFPPSKTDKKDIHGNEYHASCTVYMRRSLEN